MAKYNAAKHTIETESGELLATLSDSIRADEAWVIADNWGSAAHNALHEEIEDLGCSLSKVQQKLDDAKDKIQELKEELTEARSKIRELQEQPANEKGAAQ